VKVRSDVPRGSPEKPLTRAQLQAKFRTYARGRLDETRIGDVISSVSDLENLASVRSLMELLRCA
jgi:2-methylcitrate dehydratase PrpD